MKSKVIPLLFMIVPLFSNAQKDLDSLIDLGNDLYHNRQKEEALKNGNTFYPNVKNLHPLMAQRYEIYNGTIWKMIMKK